MMRGRFVAPREADAHDVPTMLGQKCKDLAPRAADAHDARPCWAEISRRRRLMLMMRGRFVAPREADAHDVPTMLGDKCKNLAPRAADAHDARPCWAEISHGWLMLMMRGRFG